MKNKIINGLLQLVGIMAIGAVVGYSVGKNSWRYTFTWGNT